MSENSKYESTLNDLTLIESEVAILVEKLRISTETLKEREVQYAMLKQENQQLNKRLSELEFELENLKLTKHNEAAEQIYTDNTNEALKAKIKNLISRIDFHLSS